MKRFILIACLLLTACVPKITMPNLTPVNDASYQRVIDLPGLTKQQIFEKSKQWMAKTFISSKQVIEYENLQEGQIIGNSTANLTFTVVSSLVGPVTSSYQARFTITEDIKDGKARITFDRVWVQNLNAGREGEGITQDGWNQLKPKLISLAQNLTEHLTTSSPKNW